MKKIKMFLYKHYISFLYLQWGIFILVSFLLLSTEFDIVFNHVIIFSLNIFIFELIYIINIIDKKNYISNNNFITKYKHKKNIIKWLMLERHNCFNHLQVMYGFLQLKRYDKLDNQIEKIVEEIENKNPLYRIKNQNLLDALFKGIKTAKKNNINMTIEIKDSFSFKKGIPYEQKVKFAECLKLFQSIIMNELIDLESKYKVIKVKIGNDQKNHVYALLLYPAVIYDDIIEKSRIKNNVFDNFLCNGVRFRVSKSRILIIIC